MEVEGVGDVTVSSSVRGNSTTDPGAASGVGGTLSGVGMAIVGITIIAGVGIAIAGVVARGVVLVWVVVVTGVS